MITKEIVEKLNKLGYHLTEAGSPIGSYLNSVISGNLLFTSGKLPLKDGKLAYTGKVGKDVTIEEAQEAARLCIVEIISLLKKDLNDDLSKIKRIVKINGFVQSGEGFDKQHLVLNGASDLIVELFGENGKHARAAIGVAELPLNASVEIDVIIELK